MKIPTMLKVHFFARGFESANPTDNITIYCQLELLGLPRDTPFSTKIKLPKKYWAHSKVKDTYFKSTFLNTNLQDLERCLLTIHQALHYSSLDVNYQNIKSRYCIKTNQIKSTPPKTILAVLQETINFRTKSLEQSTKLTYRTRYKNIKSWIHSTNNNNILITDIRHRHFTDLNNYLVSLNNIGIDHRNKHLTLLKQVLDFAVNQEYITHSPVTKLNLQYTAPKPPKYLNPAHRLKIQNYQGSALAIAQDLALFLIYTGLSYTDYLSLNHSHLVYLPNQGTYIKKKRNKTDIYQIIPLLPQAKRILDKYGINSLPRPDMSDLNKQLKYLQELCNIPASTLGFSLSTSVFRETFATMMENEYMLPTRVIMTMMGHSTTKQLNTYSNVMPSRIHHELSNSIPNWQDIIAA